MVKQAQDQGQQKLAIIEAANAQIIDMLEEFQERAIDDAVTRAVERVEEACTN